MQSEAAGWAGEPSGEGEEASSEGLGGYHLLPQTDAHCPAGQVMGYHLDGQPGGVGGEAARGEMVEADAVLQVSDGILNLGVAAMVGLQFQGFPVPVGDEAVIAVGGEEGQLGTGRRLHPPHDEPHRGGVRLGLEGGAGGVASALAVGACIDDADALGAGGTVGVLGCVVKAPSTPGTFLRSFRWGHVRQLDRVSRQLLARAWAAGAGPGDSPLTIDLASTTR